MNWVTDVVMTAYNLILRMSAVIMGCQFDRSRLHTQPNAQGSFIIGIFIQ